MSNPVQKNRLMKELMDLERDPPPGISCYPKDDNITELEACIKGPPDTPYDKGFFKLDIQVPVNYPFGPPQIRFVTRIYHPNIDNAGRICVDILKGGSKGSWKPSMNLSTTLISLTQLLANPNPDDPLDAEIAREFQVDYPTFKQKAVDYTKRYAKEEQEQESEPAEEDTVRTNQQIEKESEEHIQQVGNMEDQATQMIDSKEVHDKPKLSLSLSKKKNSSQASISSQASASQGNANCSDEKELQSPKEKGLGLDEHTNNTSSIATTTQVDEIRVSIQPTPLDQPNLAKTESEDSLNGNPKRKGTKKVEVDEASIDKPVKKPRIVEKKVMVVIEPPVKKKGRESTTTVSTENKLNDNNLLLKKKEHTRNAPEKRKLDSMSSIVVLSDNEEEEGVLHSFQLSKKLKRPKLSLSKHKK